MTEYQPLFTYSAFPFPFLSLAARRRFLEHMVLTLGGSEAPIYLMLDDFRSEVRNLVGSLLGCGR